MITRLFNDLLACDHMIRDREEKSTYDLSISFCVGCAITNGIIIVIVWLILVPSFYRFFFGPQAKLFGKLRHGFTRMWNLDGGPNLLVVYSQVWHDPKWFLWYKYGIIVYFQKNDDKRRMIIEFVHIKNWRSKIFSPHFPMQN